MKGYVYKWTDLATNKIYIGARRGSPTGDKYICSSPKMKKEYYKRKQDFVKEILFEGDIKDVAEFEWLKITELFDKKIPCYNTHKVRYNTGFDFQSIFHCNDDKFNLFK